MTGTDAGSSAENGAIRVRQPAGFEHHDDDVGFTEALAHGAIHAIVEERAMRRLVTGRIDEDELCTRCRENPENPVTRGLRLLRGDAHSCADESV